MGVAEMTRFGMKEEDFATLAGLMADTIRKGSPVKAEVSALRRQFATMQYCFSPKDMETAVETMAQELS